MLREDQIRDKVWEMFCMIRDPHPERETWNKAYLVLALELSTYWVKTFKETNSASYQETNTSHKTTNSSKPTNEEGRDHWD